jgi:hypothetical protein
MESWNPVMLGDEQCGACRAATPLLPIVRCPSCGVPACAACRHADLCAACALVALGELLRGVRRVPVTLAARRIVDVVFAGPGDPSRDLSVSAAGFTARLPNARPLVYDRALGPAVVSVLLECAGLTTLAGPTVARLGDPATAAARRAQGAGPVVSDGGSGPAPSTAITSWCAWFVPSGTDLEVRVRPVTPEDLPRAPAPVPAAGPLALPTALAPWTPAPARWVERSAHVSCPHCGAAARRLRDLGSALVCPACHRSFAV